MGHVAWLPAPEDHGYPAAGSNYLALLAPASPVTAPVDALRTADTVHHKAKDILRASGLPLLPADNPHVAADLRKVNKGEAPSPILLARGDLQRGRSLQVADHYHRVCASYHTDENTDIPCRIAHPPTHPA